MMETDKRPVDENTKAPMKGDESGIGRPAVKKSHATAYVAIMVVLVVIVATVFNVFYAGNTAESQKTGAISIVDSAGNTVTLDKAPDRIWVEDKVFEIYALGCEHKIVGWKWIAKTYRADVWSMMLNESSIDIAKIPDQDTLGNPNTKTLNIEKMAGLKLDLAVFSMLNTYTYYKDKLAAVRIPSVFIDLTIQSAVPANIIQLGDILGAGTRARELSAFYKQRYEEVSGVLANVTGPKPKVFLENGNGDQGSQWYTYSPSFSYGVQVELARSVNIASFGGVSTMQQVTNEFVLSQNPDIIVWAGYHRPVDAQGNDIRVGYDITPQECRLSMQKRVDSRPGWSNLTAVNNGKLYAIPLEFSRGIMDFYAMQWLAKWFYPANFTTLDPEANMVAFHTRFLGIDYKATGLAVAI